MLIELNRYKTVSHLKNSITKGLDIPKIYIETNIKVNGIYVWHRNVRHCKDNYIILSSELIGKDVSSVLTHELKHHQQRLNGTLIKNKYQPNDWHDNYEEKIFKYFTLNVNETEALFEEYKYYKTELTKGWISIISKQGQI